MQNTATVQTIASDALAFFNDARRDDGSEYVKRTDNAPDWIADMIYRIHDGMLPDDWKYYCIRGALSAIAESEGDPMDDAGEFANGCVDPYNGQRLAWLASSNYRATYCDDAAEEFGTSDDAGIIDRIGLGQYMEASEVYGLVLSALQAQVAS